MSTLFSHFFEKINKISPLEGDFTSVLDTIALKPKILYYNGNLPENMPGGRIFGQKSALAAAERPSEPRIRPKTVAIVGSRRNTAYGEEVAYRLATTLAREGVIVISGLAYGIDSVAHRGAVDAGGVTIAVLGTPIGEIYPKAHSALASRILELGGAIISEYGPNDNAKSGQESRARFLYRNRLIAGLADLVVVVEAAEHSGSLNTAMHALEQGKDLLAVPGNITNPMSQGCNKLIQQGALPYTEPKDVLDLLFPPTTKPQQQPKLIFGDNPEEIAILTALSQGISDGEEILKYSNLDAATFNRNITMLEIKGAVKSLGMNRWMAL